VTVLALGPISPKGASRKQTHKDHEVIVDTIASRDAARAAELVSDHLMRTLAWHSKLSVLRDKICFDREGFRRPAHPRTSRTAYWHTMLSASSSKSNGALLATHGEGPALSTFHAIILDSRYAIILRSLIL